MNNKIAEFYSKVNADENLKAKFDKILDGKNITEVSDDQLKEICEMAKEMGYNFNLNEVKEFIANGDVELSEEALAAVAGGITKNNSIANKCDSPGTFDRFK
jgi:predicted ribosomally synthesized peptide with nif11-like leader